MGRCSTPPWRFHATLEAVVTLSLPIAPEANDLLQRSPLALLLGMLLDQQQTMEKAFGSPYELERRLGHALDAGELADYDEEALIALFSRPPVLHRFPKAFAKRTQAMCRMLVDRYGGEAERVWSEATSGQDLLRRVQALPGFGEQKARIFVALLGKRFGVRPEGWREAAGPYGDDDAYKSVADITDEEALRRVREYKQQVKAQARG
jgi:uncharacterized HhH-GPD family protein